MSKVYVIGAGLAGLSSAIMAAEAGHRVTIITKGFGGLLLSPGTVDVCGYLPDGTPVTDPYRAVEQAAEPHPYASIGVDAVRQGVTWFSEAVPELGYRFGDTNQPFPTSIGAVRPVFGLPTTMQPGVLTDGASVLVVGFKQFKDFPAQLIADNLTRSADVNVTAKAVTLDLPIRPNEPDTVATNYARTLDSDPALVSSMASAIKKYVGDASVVLLPAFLGFNPETYDALTAKVGVPVAEIPVAPPSVAGRRINDALINRARELRIDFHLNAVAVGANVTDGHVTHVLVERAGRVTTDRVDAVIDAGGGFESGNLARTSYGQLVESIFNLPVRTPGDVAPEKLATDDEILRSGVRVDTDMRPIDATGKALYDNLHCVGGMIGGALAWQELSGEGIALGSAAAAVDAIGRTATTTKEN